MRYSLALRVLLLNIALLVVSLPLYLILLKNQEQLWIASVEVRSLNDFTRTAARLAKNVVASERCAHVIKTQLSSSQPQETPLLQPLFDALLQEFKQIASPSLVHLEMASQLSFYSAEEVESWSKEPFEDAGPNSYLMQQGAERFVLIALPIEPDLYLTSKTPYSILLHESSVRVLTFAILFLLLLGLGAIATLIASLRFSKPLRDLFETMKTVGQGELSARFSANTSLERLNEIGREFNHVTESLQRQIEIACKERLDKELLQKELSIARGIQERLFPEVVLHHDSVDIVAFSINANQVSGNFYDVLWRKDQADPTHQRLFVMIGESIATGISACLSAFCLRSMLRSYAMEHDRLLEVMSLANDLFCEDVRTSSLFATVFALSYEMTERRISYVCAGQSPAILVQAKEKRTCSLITPGIAMGLFHDNPLEERQLLLQPGDLLFLYTEGLILTTNQEGQIFGEDRLTAILLENTGRTAQEVVDEVVKQLYQFTFPSKIAKDTLIISMRIR